MGGASTVAGDRPAREPPLACPRCGYDVRQLPEPRCPECGAEFTLEAAREAAHPAPRIAFEKTTGLKNISGFLVTWLTVMFMPWKFAAQAARRIRLRDAVFFGLICNLAIGIRFLIEEPLNEIPAQYIAWIITAWIFILAQAATLAALDPSSWPRLARGWLWWVGVGGYTSAVMIAEACTAPALFFPGQLLDVARQVWTGSISLGGVVYALTWSSGWQGCAAVANLLLWLAVLLCCYVRRAQVAWGLIAALPLGLLLVVPLLLILYSGAIEWVGQPLYEFLDRLS